MNDINPGHEAKFDILGYLAALTSGTVPYQDALGCRRAVRRGVEANDPAYLLPLCSIGRALMLALPSDDLTVADPPKQFTMSDVELHPELPRVVAVLLAEWTQRPSDAAIQTIASFKQNAESSASWVSVIPQRQRWQAIDEALRLMLVRLSLYAPVARLWPTFVWLTDCMEPDDETLMAAIEPVISGLYGHVARHLPNPDFF